MSDKLNRFEIPFVKTNEFGDLIPGYANKAIIDQGGDLIPAEVWFDALQAFFKEGMPIKLLHRPKIQAGETVEMKISHEGLWLLSRPTLPEVKGLIDKGLLVAYSIGYVPLEWMIRPDGGRTITKLDLKETSYVDEPMNQGSYFGGIKLALRDEHEVRFDIATGTVTVLGLNPEEMGSLSKLLGQGLEAAGVESIGAVKSIEFKVAQPDQESPVSATPSAEKEEVMNWLKKIWGRISTQAPEEAKNMEEQKTNQTEPVEAPAPEKEEERNEEAKTQTLESALQDQIAELKAKAEEQPTRLEKVETELAELKGMFGQLVEVVRDMTPDQRSLPVTDTSNPSETKSWNLFRR